MKRVKIRKIPKLSNDFQGVRYSLVGVISARKIKMMKRAANAAFVVNTGIAENEGPSSEIVVVDLDEKDGRNFSAKATLSRGFAETRDENTSKKAVPHFFQVE